jgi:hypothetical protein
MDKRTWIVTMVALWALLIANQFLTDGWVRVAVGSFLVLGFAAVAVERFRNWRAHR